MLTKRQLTLNASNFVSISKDQSFQTSSIGGSIGKLVTLESRTELDCLIEFINDEFDDPKTLSKYTLGLKGKTNQDKGIFKWQGADTSIDFDAATPSWSNW